MLRVPNYLSGASLATRGEFSNTDSLTGKVHVAGSVRTPGPKNSRCAAKFFRAANLAVRRTNRRGSRGMAIAHALAGSVPCKVIGRVLSSQAARRRYTTRNRIAAEALRNGL